MSYANAFAACIYWGRRRFCCKQFDFDSMFLEPKLVEVRMNESEESRAEQSKMQDGVDVTQALSCAGFVSEDFLSFDLLLIQPLDKA
jgi:hypothetical protein